MSLLLHIYEYYFGVLGKLCDDKREKGKRHSQFVSSVSGTEAE